MIDPRELLKQEQALVEEALQQQQQIRDMQKQVNEMHQKLDSKKNNK